jgi:nicotinate-nucleotide adenylyltransferase
MNSSVPARHAKTRIGLLGGSFNPAHEGHREITLEALKLFDLDVVWWLVTPGNPLKDADTYAPYPERLAAARRVANHHRIIVSNFEDRKNLQYTVDTLSLIRDLWPDAGFLWLMGADSLAGFHNWRDWRRIAELAPMAVFSRPGFEDAHKTSVAGRDLSAFRIPPTDARALFDTDPPVWTFVSSTANPQSSTAIRKRLGG